MLRRYTYIDPALAYTGRLTESDDIEQCKNVQICLFPQTEHAIVLLDNK